MNKIKRWRNEKKTKQNQAHRIQVTKIFKHVIFMLIFFIFCILIETKKLFSLFSFSCRFNSDIPSGHFEHIICLVRIIKAYV